MNSTVRSLVFWVRPRRRRGHDLELLHAVPGGDNSASFSEFVRWVDAGQVETVTIAGNEITGTLTAGDRFRTYAPPQYEGLVNQLVDRDVAVTAREAENSPWATLLYSWAPFLLIIGFWIFFMRQMKNSGNKALSFGRSRAKLSTNTQKKVTFKDVAGVDEPKGGAARDHRIP